MRKCVLAFSLCVLFAACIKEQNEQTAEPADTNNPIAGYTEEVDWEWCRM